MKLTIFGANLRDQSHGQFVVHAANCADCNKLKNELQSTGEFASRRAVAELIWDECFEDRESLIADEAEIHFSPCVQFPVN